MARDVAGDVMEQRTTVEVPTPEQIAARAEMLRSRIPYRVEVTPELVCAWRGEMCTRPVVFGTCVCAKHVKITSAYHGKLRSEKADAVAGVALRLAEEAGMAVRSGKLGERLAALRRDNRIDPGIVLMEEVARAATIVAWLEDEIAQMSVDSLLHEPELLQIRERKRSQVAGGDSYDVERTEERSTVSRYWKLLQDERKLLVRASEAALRSGIEERRVRLAERGVNTLETAVAAALADLGIDPHSDEVRAVVGRRMREALDAGGEGGIFLSGPVPSAALAVPSSRVIDAKPEEAVAPPPATPF